jgi:hypothetical protein
METLKPASRPVRPINPVAPYIGGKKVLAKTIVPLLDSIDHTTYARFDQQEVNVTYTVGGNKTPNTSELIISRAKVRRLI